MGGLWHAAQAWGTVSSCQLVTEVEDLWEGQREEGIEGSGHNPATFSWLKTLFGGKHVSENEEGFYSSRPAYFLGWE